MYFLINTSYKVAMDKLRLFDAEYKFMSIIWDCEPVNSTELSRVCLDKLGWKKPTTYNMIKKLSERGILKNENATVTALVKKSDVQKYESEAIIEKSFDNSLPSFLTAFLGNKKISKSEADELRRIIEEASK